MARADPAVTALGTLAAYNLVQNVVIPEAGYVPANVAVTAGLVAFARRSGLASRDIGLDPADLRSGLRLGGVVAGGIAAGFVAGVWSGRFDRWLLDERARGHKPAGAAYRSMVRFPVGTALFEEVAFRGVLDGLWRRRSGPGAARAVTASAFGLWHILPTYRLYPSMGLGAGHAAGTKEKLMATVGSVLLTAASSFGFALLRDRSQSVAAPWLAHAAYNTGGYLAARRVWQRSGD